MIRNDNKRRIENSFYEKKMSSSILSKKNIINIKRKNNGSVKIIPLGGLDEIGKNMTLIEYDNDIIIIDCGMAFPDNEMLGVDIVIPDFSYIEDNRHKVRGVVLTHGHEDHIGGLAYLFKAVGQLPVYGTELTLGLVENKLKEHRLLDSAKLSIVTPGEIVRLGTMKVEFITVNHSIPGSCGLAITTPAGVIVHTGDFKIDYTPIDGEVMNLSRFADLGNQGVLALLSDSTNSERPGMTVSERKIGTTFKYLITRARDRRVIIATFASNIHRIQQIIDIAAESGRKVVLSGKSMELVVARALELKYLKAPKNIIVSINQMKNYSTEKLIIVTTGSQGEPMSALKRMSAGDHSKVSITANDFVIISANPIPGNEKFVNKVINDLMKLGAHVIYEDMYEVHVSGHAFQNEQKLMINLIKPQYFLPVHGEYKHLKKHAETAVSMGMHPSNVHIGQIGEVISISRRKMAIKGKVMAGNVMVDGLGIGDVGSIVLRDRKILSEDGLIIIVIAINKNDGSVIAGPDVVSRGFVYVKESEILVKEIKKIAGKVLNKCFINNIRDWNVIKTEIKDNITGYLYSTIKRTPMILTIIQDIDI